MWHTAIQSLGFLHVVRGVVHTKFVVVGGSLRDCFFCILKASPGKGGSAREKRGGRAREQGGGKGQEGGRRGLQNTKETIFGELRASQNHEFSSYSPPDNM